MLDDYADIQAKYFTSLVSAGNVDADPSGWLATYSEAESLLLLPHLTARDFARYYLDVGDSMGAYKQPVARLLSVWEGHPVSVREFTLCPSGATASLVTLAMLKALGVTGVLFETPCYFATIEQAQQIQLPFELIPTYLADSYEIPDLRRRLRKNCPNALWLTQPRASLGFDQSLKHIELLLEELGPRGYLIVDEATDQSFPAHLGSVCTRESNATLIRIRSFTKGMGLNGFRLAALLHPAALRTFVVAALETFGGAVDVHSLKAVADFANDISRLQEMLRAANHQVNVLRARAEKLVINSPLAVNRLTNGYIGTLVADLTVLGRTQLQRRTRLLEGCRGVRTPVMLGSTFYMAKDPPREAIRLNFFMEPDNVTRGINNVLQIWSQI